MNVVHSYPPNIEEIKKYVTPNEHTLFTYGDTIYFPAGDEVADHLFAHEETHMRQQFAFGGPAVWWEKYLADKNFRLRQEVEAYRNQWNFFTRNTRDRNKTFLFLHWIASDLSGVLYGNVISYEKAKKLIKGETSL